MKRNSLNIFQFFRVILFFGLMMGVRSENALLVSFEPDVLLVNNQNLHSDDTTICSSCFIACPDFSPKENIINNKASIGGSAVFLCAFLYKYPVKNIKTDVCKSKKQLKATILWNTSSNSFETGYELFYDPGTLPLKFEKYDLFKKVPIIDDKTNKEYESPSQNTDKVEKTMYNGNTTFRINDSSTREWTYYWIRVLSIRALGYQRQISFTKDTGNASTTMSMCNDYNLGDESQKLPSQKWQKQQQQLLLKEASKLDSDSQLKPMNDPAKKPQTQTNDNALEEIQIMPMRYFHSLSAKLATCIYLNVAYIWRQIANEQYKKIDLYLYSMYELWPSKINIIFGTKGISNKFSSSEIKKLQPPGIKIFEENPIPVPKIIYRIVEFNLQDEIYNAIVILHNHIGSTRISRFQRICSKKSEVESWDDIKNEKEGAEIKPGITYVCPVTQKIVEKLEAQYEITSTMRTLKLNTFPRLNEMFGGVIYEDKRDRIMEQMEYNRYYNYDF